MEVYYTACIFVINACTYRLLHDCRVACLIGICIVWLVVIKHDRMYNRKYSIAVHHD